MDKSKHNNRKKGQLLVEAMVAISMMMVGMLGVFGVLSQSLGLNRVAADQYTAVNLASEGIEIVKNLLDSDYMLDRAWGSSLQYSDDCAIDYQTQPAYVDNGATWRCNYNGKIKFFPGIGYKYDVGGKETNFIRYVRITNGNPIKVSSVVEWSGRGGVSFNVILEDEFYNWRL